MIVELCGEKRSCQKVNNRPLLTETLKLEQLKTVLGWRRRLTMFRCRVPCLFFASGTSIQGRQILLQHKREN